jgi:hypothetical protein
MAVGTHCLALELSGSEESVEATRRLVESCHARPSANELAGQDNIGSGSCCLILSANELIGGARRPPPPARTRRSTHSSSGGPHGCGHGGRRSWG